MRVERPVRIVIPFKLKGAKSRLSPVLSPEERMRLALAMLEDILEVVSYAGPVTLLARPGLNRSILSGDPGLIECDLDLNDALNCLISEHESQGWPSDLMIVMADLALLTRADVSGILSSGGDVVLSPGRGGGTNAILIRDPGFRTCYQGHSFLRHLEFCARAGIEAGIYATYWIGCDVDEPDDLSEVLIHGRGRSKKVLEDLGFRLSEQCRGGSFRSRA